MILPITEILKHPQRVRLMQAQAARQQQQQTRAPKKIAPVSLHTIFDRFLESNHASTIIYGLLVLSVIVMLFSINAKLNKLMCKLGKN